MRVIHTSDLNVFKIVHDDGSETAVKTSPSVRGLVSAGGVDRSVVDRGKYSIVVSNSVGCRMRCQFCHLTMKNAAYSALPFSRIVANVQEAMTEVARLVPDIGRRYAKLCWMGMGEDAISRPDALRRATLEIADWLIDGRLAQGIDGVDLGTVLPRTRADWVGQLAALDRELDRYATNPQIPSRAEGRSRFRLFYSLHSAVQQTRNDLVPGATPLAQALPKLLAYSDGGRHNLVFHYMLWEGVNDTEAEVAALIELIERFGLWQHEIRFLRFNGCGVSPLLESTQFDAIARRVAATGIRTKVQASPGREVMAACGMFIITERDLTGSASRDIVEIARDSADIMRQSRP